MSEWICLESFPLHLPEPGSMVLVYTRRGATRLAAYYSRTEGEVWLTVPGRWRLTAVTHWMPLPEAPDP